MVFITIQVPPNVEAGVDKLAFEYDGKELEMLVPPGSVEGDVLQIEVGGVDESDDHEGVNNDETTDAIDTEERSSGLISMSLGDGAILHIHDSINDNCRIITETGEDGTNGMIWTAGTVLAQALTSSFGIQFLIALLTPSSAANATMDQLNCLELGSGLGVCGLALAHALNSIGRESDNSLLEHSIIANILLTDRGEDTVQLLRKNIQSNHPANNDQNTTTTAESLVWGNTIQHNNNNKGSDTKYHIIIGSDLLYNTQESYIPLLTTIQQHCHEEGIVLLAVRWRKPDLECRFFELAESNYGLLFELWNEFTTDTTFGGRRCPCLLHWKEYGNPKSELLHIFFTETKVNAGGKEMSLGQVTEKDMEVMSDEEYSIFEELQIQIYVGRYNDGKTITTQKRQRKGV